MNKKMSKSGLPELKLTGVDYTHRVPDDTNLEMTVIWKGKMYENETIGPVHAFGKEGGFLKVINRNNTDTRYSFKISQIRSVVVLPIDM